jgi:mono/diheme cytochrome c family protein
MKKILCAIGLAVLVWGCAKKMTPAKTESPTSNSGSLSNNTVPLSTAINPGKSTGSAVTSTTVTTTANPATTESTTTAGSRTAPTTTSPEAAAVMAGMQTFNAKCGRCHGLKVTTNYTAERWASILAVMAPKANLTEEEKNNVYAYVKENSKK